MIEAARSSPVRAALLGLGRMGTVHANAAAGAGSLEIVAFAEPDDRLARRAREILGPSCVRYRDALEALGHPGLDACVIVTPTTTHAAITHAAFDRGLHVLCEKPLSLDIESSVSLAERARSAGRILQVGFWRRFAAPWVTAQREIAKGSIGEPIAARSQQWDANLASLAFANPAVSGGLLIDFGVHDYDVVEWLTGQRIETVDVRRLRLVEPGLAEINDLDNAIVLLGMTGAVHGTAELSANVRYADDVRAEVLGSEGAVFVRAHPHGHTLLGTSEGLRSVPDSEIPGDTFSAGIRCELAAFAEAVLQGSGDANVPGAAESIRALAVGLAARASLQCGEAVAVEETLSGRITAERALGPLPPPARWSQPS